MIRINLWILPALAILTGPVVAEQIRLHATLAGAAQVPPVGTKGTGTLTATYDTITKQFTYDVTYSGLTGPALMAHFHAPAGLTKNAPIVVPTPNPASPIHATATLTDTLADDLLNGRMYFHVHTEAQRAGEIRGQLLR